MMVFTNPNEILQATGNKKNMKKRPLHFIFRIGSKITSIDHRLFVF